MLLQQTINILANLKLYEMINALKEQEENQQYQDLTFLERLGILADRQMIYQENRSLASRIRKARLRHQAVFEDIDMSPSRGINKTLILELGTCRWVKDHENILILGPTGAGKTWLACALAQKACREGHTVLYHRLSKLLYELAINKGEGSYLKALKSIAKVEILILDDWGLDLLNKDQRHDLLEILEDRHGTKSTIITSQLPTDAWHDFIGEETFADAIMDRLIHNAQILNLKGDSMRKKRKTKTNK